MPSFPLYGMLFTVWRCQKKTDIPLIPDGYPLIIVAMNALMDAVKSVPNHQQQASGCGDTSLILYCTARVSKVVYASVCSSLFISSGTTNTKRARWEECYTCMGVAIFQSVA